jgi:hypothetical protein
VADRRVVSHRRVIRVAMAQFARTATLDMEGLAVELAVSRATLYRVAQSRAALFADVMRAFTEMLFANARAGRTRDGVDGVIEVSRRFAEQMSATDIMRRFVAAEPGVAGRVVFVPSGPIHQVSVARQIDVFTETGVARTLGSETDIRQIAYLYVRMVGTFIYSEYFSGGPVPFSTLEPALRSLLTSRPALSAD